MKTKEQPQPKYRKDYKPTPYLVDKVNLSFDLHEEHAKVIARSSVKPNHDGVVIFTLQQCCAMLQRPWQWV